MSEQAESDHDAIVSQVQEDVEATFGPAFVARHQDADDGFRRVDTFGDGGVVTGQGGGSAFTFVRWEFRGHHDGPLQSPLGDARTVRATGNKVVVDGLTAIEARPDGTFRARRYVDWLSVYAQLGVIVASRPVGMADITLLDAPPARLRDADGEG